MIERLKLLRKDILSLSQEEFANHIGLKKSAISDIERCKANLTERNIKAICQTFNVNEDWLRNGNEPIFNEKDNNNYVDELVKKYNINSDEVNIIKRFANLDENSRNKIINFVFEIVKENIDKIDENKILQFSDTTKIGKYTVNNINEELSITEEDIQEIKLYEIPASAGTGSFIDCDVPYEIKKVDLTVAPQARRADFALYIRGDSMEPDYYDGDIVFVKEQPKVDNGQIGIFIYDDVSYIKKYSVQDDGVYLISLNDKYQPIKVDKSTPFKTCGLVL